MGFANGLVLREPSWVGVTMGRDDRHPFYGLIQLDGDRSRQRRHSGNSLFGSSIGGSPGSRSQGVLGHQPDQPTKVVRPLSPTYS